MKTKTKTRKALTPRQRAEAESERDAAARLMQLGYLVVWMHNIRAKCRTLYRSHPQEVQRMLAMGIERSAMFRKIVKNLEKQVKTEFACFAPLTSRTPMSTRLKDIIA